MPSAARRPQRPFQAIAYASPLKTARRGSSRPAKRQKIAVSPTKSRSENSQSNYGDEDDPIILSDSTSESENDGRPLFSHRGAAVSNRGKAKQSKAPKGKGVEFRLKKQRSRNFAQYATSPRKRKRDVWNEQGVDPDADAHPDDDDDDDDDFESYDGSSSVRSLQEHPIQEDPELEPVFMKDGERARRYNIPGSFELTFTSRRLQMTITCCIKHLVISSTVCEKQSWFASGKLLESGKERRTVSRVNILEMSRRIIANLN